MSDAGAPQKTTEPTDAQLAAAAGLTPKQSPLVPALLLVNTALLAVVVAKVFLAPAPAGGAAEAPPAEHAAAAPAGPGPMVKLPEFVVHLRNPEAERYARLSLEVEVGSEPDKEKLNANMPRIREAFLSYLADRTVDDLRGSEGIERAKRELLARLSTSVPGSPVRSIYVTDIVIQ